MRSLRVLTRSLRRSLLAAVVLLAGASVASAISIGTNESVLVIQNNGSEAYVNLGVLANVDASGNVVSVPGLASPLDLTSAAALVGGLTGAKFAVLAVDDPDGTLRSVDFGFGPTNLNSFFTTTNADATAYVDQSSFDGGIANARPLIDNNGPASFISGLPNVSSLAATDPNSFNLKLGNSLGSQMPFDVTTTLLTDTASLDFWFLEEGVNAFSAFGGPPAKAILLGTFDISAPLSGTPTLSFTSVATPEPGTLLLMATGLAGLVRYGRRRE